MMKINKTGPNNTAKTSADPAALKDPNRQALAKEAAKVASAAQATGGPDGVKHALVEKFGETVGLALGVVVTEALAAVPSWNAPLKDKSGQPVKSVEGATRIGNHDLRKRHEEVVGPKILAYVANLHPGMVHDLLEGLGIGAKKAPGNSYRLEAAASDLLRKL